MKNNNACSFCGKQNVKLWRPFDAIEPFICATCAEERQSHIEYHETIYTKVRNFYIGKSTDKKLPLAKWTVADDGTVPSYDGPGPEDFPQMTTNILIIDLEEPYSREKVTMIPAISDEDGTLLKYSAISRKLFNWWEKLPTNEGKKKK